MKIFASLFAVLFLASVCAAQEPVSVLGTTQQATVQVVEQPVMVATPVRFAPLRTMQCNMQSRQAARRLNFQNRAVPVRSRVFVTVR